MIKGWKKSTLGEACRIEKGKASAANEPSGIYPLITTGEGRKNAATWQFEGPAVCVPMISAFGHGKPGLNRVHYQKGKFALANILSVLLVKNPNELSAKFLHVFLNFYKDQLIVPLQFGAANMSITVERLATVPIWFPSFQEQERILDLIDEAESLRATRERANARMEQFVPALFQEMFGKSGKWKKAKIGDITQVKTGGTPSRKEPKYFGGNIPWVKTTEVNQAVILDTEEKITQEAIKNSNCEIFPPETILLAMYGQGITRGRTGKLGISATTNQACAAILPSAEYDTDYLWTLLQMSYEKLRSLGRGGNQPNLNLSMVKNFEVTLPPLALQREFAARVEEARGVQAAQGKSSEKIEALYQSMLSRAFEGVL